jgi:uncharacterized Zn finger protein (UPF0148 family)
MELHSIYECPQCQSRLALPTELDETDQMEIMRSFRLGRKIETVMLIRSKFNLGLGECKTMMVHISEQKDHCAKCGHTLLETGITYCPSCSGLNLNW